MLQIFSDEPYQVTGADLPQDTYAQLYWASGPTENDIIDLASNPVTIPKTTPLNTPITEHVAAADLFTPPPAGATHLVLVVDPGKLIDEGTAGEANNVVSTQVVFSPRVTLSLPQSAEMGEQYELGATIVSNSSVPTLLNVGCDEFHLSSVNQLPLMFPVGGCSQQSFILTPNSAVQLSGPTALGTFSHTWEWIPKQNPIETVPTTLRDIRNEIISMIVEGKLDEVLGGTGGLLGKLNFVGGLVAQLGQGLLQPTWADAYSYRALINNVPFPASADITLTVPLWKKAHYFSYLAYDVAASASIGAAIASLSFPAMQPETFATGLLVGVWTIDNARSEYDQAKDPPDPNFTEISVPVIPTVAELQQIPGGVWKDYAETALQLHAVKIAEASSRDRAMGAQQAGEPAWESRQLITAAGFAADAAALTTRLVGIQKILEQFVSAQLAPASEQIVPFLQTQGLPESGVRHLSELGWTAQQIEALRQNLIEVGPSAIQNLNISTTALRIAGPASSDSAVEDLARGVAIRVNSLRLAVRDLAPDERRQLDDMRQGIRAGLEQKIPSNSLVTTVKDYIAIVRALVLDTNNLSALQDDLDFGYGALIQFQKFDVLPSNLEGLVSDLASTGGISDPGLANSLEQVVGSAQTEMVEGHFYGMRGDVRAFLQLIEAHRGNEITVEAADTLSAYASYLRELLPPNQSPVLNSIANQLVDEGSTVSFNVTAFDPDVDDSFAYSLDFAPAGASIDPNTGLFTWTPTDGPATAQATVRVTDNGSPALSDTKTFTITVYNVPPTAAIAGPTDGVRGQPRTFTLSANDPSPIDQAAGFTFNIDWGDGSMQTVAGPSGLQLDHVYADAGSYTVHVAGADKDGGVSAVATQPIAIKAAEIQGDTLAVGGMLGNDTILFSPAGNSDGIDVSINGSSLGTFKPTGRIVAYGQAGDDDIQVAGSISLPAWLYGGAGNDRLKGGGGPSVLVGGDGDDLLVGGKGSNILIGGTGADRIVGGAGDDLLIAGNTAFDASQAALDAILAEWSSARDYATRIANLTGTGSGPRLNGNYFLLADVTVFDDGVKDQLTGSAGLDAFFANTQGAGVLDKLTDLGKLELAMDV